VAVLSFLKKFTFEVVHTSCFLHVNNWCRDTPQQQQKTPSSRLSQLFKYGYHLCPGLSIYANKDFSIGGVSLHSLCAAEAWAAGSDAEKGLSICLVLCLHFSKIEGPTNEKKLLRLDFMTRTLVLQGLTSIVNNFWSCTWSFWIWLEITGYYPKLKSYRVISKAHISFFMPPTIACNFLVWGSNLLFLCRSCQPNVWKIKVSYGEYVVVVGFCPQLPPCCGGSVNFMVLYRELKF